MRDARAAVTDGALDLVPAPERISRAMGQLFSIGADIGKIDAVFEALLHEKLHLVAQDRTEAEIRGDDR